MSENIVVFPQNNFSKLSKYYIATLEIMVSVEMYLVLFMGIAVCVFFLV